MLIDLKGKVAIVTGAGRGDRKRDRFHFGSRRRNDSHP